MAEVATALNQTATATQAKRPANDDELRCYLSDTFNVVLPDVQCCANHSTPFRAFAQAYFARSPVAIWKASRGFGGKSYMLALLGLTEALTLGADVAILGGSGRQSGRVHDYISEWYYAVDNATRRQFASEPLTHETRFAGGNVIEALMASQRSVRGAHPQRLRLDEADEVDIKLLDAAMGQPMRRGDVQTQIVFSSTHQYPDGTMTTLLQRAAAKGWPVHEWCWRETSNAIDGWLSEAEIEEKRAAVTAAMWQIEYDLQEPSSDNRAILSEAVARMFRRDLGTYDGRPREVIEIEQPTEGGKYATGADWARKQDWTIISTIRYDVRPARVVAWQRRGREPWPAMIAAFDSQCAKYRGRNYYDATGIGDVVGQYMKTNATGVMMIGNDRRALLTDYIADIEGGAIESPFVGHAEAEHRYASVDDVYSSEQAHHLPDSIAAGALAWRGAKQVRLQVG